ncbi:MAG TPA: MFS transporter [Desulfobacterales bacterium]|nr:MFS transporter [Desulfobacterales bacterium]
MPESSSPSLYNKVFIQFALANLFTVSSFGIFFIFPLYIKSHGGSEADIGIIMGAFALSSVLCRPWVSEMIDRLGRKRSYSMGALTMAVMPLGYMLLKGNIGKIYGPLLLFRLIHGVGLAICFTASFTYIADVLPRERINEGIGMFGATGLVGLALGPVIGEMVARRFGFPYFFVAGAVFGGAGFALHLPLPESYRPKLMIQGKSFFGLMVERKIFLVAVLAFLFGLGLAASGNFVAPYAKDKGISIVSVYYVFYSLSAVSTRLLGGRIADKVGEQRVIPYALVITGVGLLMLAFLGGNGILIVAGVLAGCGHGFLFPCLNALVIRDEPAHVRGKVTGIFTGGIDAGSFLGSIFLGYIGQVCGYRTLFITSGLALFIGLYIYLRRLPNE